jgi:CheY-like chemotaxis protein
MPTGNQGQDSSPAPPRLHLPLRKPRTLLVEDEVKQLDLRRELLQLRNLEVIPASSRAEAVNRLQSVDYEVDVVVTDLNLDESASVAGGVGVARAVSEHSGRAIPVYAYSGKSESMPSGDRNLFKKFVLKASKTTDVRAMFDEATSDANEHFRRRVARAHDIIEPLAQKPHQLNPQEVSLLRDLMAGAVRTLGVPRVRQPESVGLLVLAEAAALPYVIEIREERVGVRFYASVLGHEYLFGYGQSEDEASGNLQAIVEGYVTLVNHEKDIYAVGPSRRMRKMLKALFSRTSTERGQVG